MHISGRKGAGYLAHNNREFYCENVDSKRTQYNIIYKNESLEEAYEKLFGDSFREYNNKVRKDRKFDGTYLEKLTQSKRNHKEKLFHEWIVQIGDCSQVGYVPGQNYQDAERALNKYMKSFQERNPHLYVFNAILHRDEKTPHVHIDFISWAEYEKGQKIRNSLTKALEQQGFQPSEDRKHTSTMAWQVREREVLREYAREYFPDIEDEQHNNNKHLPVAEYKEAKALEQKSIEEIVDLVQRNENFLKIILRAMNVILGKEKLYTQNKEYDDQCR